MLVDERVDRDQEVPCAERADLAHRVAGWRAERRPELRRKPARDPPADDVVDRADAQVAALTPTSP